MPNGYTRKHPVGIEVEAQMLEIVAGYDEAQFDRELAFALGSIDTDDPASMRWLACLLAARIAEVEANR